MATSSGDAQDDISKRSQIRFTARSAHSIEARENVILSAAASPVSTRTNAWRRPKDLGSALGPRGPERGRTGGSSRGWRSVVLLRLQVLRSPPECVAEDGNEQRRRSG